MSVNLIDLSQAKKEFSDDLPGLHACLAQLIGEPFRFARVSYGDELTLHFGELRPALSPKLKDRQYGLYVLGLRGSQWLLKSGPDPVVLISGVIDDPAPNPLGTPLPSEQLETGRFIEPGSRALTATPFKIKPGDGFGLEIRMADGSTLVVIPSPQEPDGPEDEGLPMLADWELLSPQGLLSAGPGPRWSFDPSRISSTRRTTEPVS